MYELHGSRDDVADVGRHRPGDGVAALRHLDAVAEVAALSQSASREGTGQRHVARSVCRRQAVKVVKVEFAACNEAQELIL